MADKANKNEGAGRRRSIAGMLVALAVLLVLMYLVPDSLGLVPYAGDSLGSGDANAVLRTCAGVAVLVFAAVRGLLLRRAAGRDTNSDPVSPVVTALLAVVGVLLVLWGLGVVS